MRVGPVGITNGVFGNRPHCIYRGFCLQGCKVNAKASPLVTHLPDAIAHGVEVRADSHVTRIELDAAGRCTGVVYLHDGRERFQRAAVVVVAGYSIETPRLLLNSTSARFPHGLANDNDQVGRYVMVQGALAGRRALPPDLATSTRLRRRRSAPSSSTRPTPRAASPAGSRSRPSVRCRSAGPSMCSPTATGGTRCVSTCATTTTGHARLLCELLPQPENRVTLADRE